MAGKNDFLIFDENDINSLSTELYSTDEQRLNGVSSGIARSKLINKVLRQVSLMCSAIGQVVSDSGGNAVEEFEELVSALKMGFSFSVEIVSFSKSDWQYDNDMRYYKCTKNIDGIVSNEENQLIMIIPKKDSITKSISYNILGYEQKENSIDFICKRLQNEELINVYVLSCMLK